MEARRKKTQALTASLEDYLEAIQNLIDSHGHAHTSEIARLLQIKMPSVTNAMGILRDRGYINYSLNNPVTLTKLGEKVALRVKQRHLVLSAFLTKVLHLSESDSDSLACSMEHVINDALLEKLTLLTEELSGDDPAYDKLRKLLA